MTTRTAPDFAVSLFPANGLAREQLAAKTFTAGITEPDDAPEAARQAADIAVAAVLSDPLVPKAYAILALAQPEEAKRRAILDVASQINRRDLFLQGLVLQEHIAERNYPRTIETLDQILRVNPEYSREFFPVLVEALGEEETIPLFANMLDGSSPWHQRFLNFAVGQREILPNLAVLRQDVFVDDENFDRRLIAGLAGQGDIAGAEALYRRVSGSDTGLGRYGLLDWKSAYPPFDWRFVDQTGFRAQQSADGKELELSVRPGKGGIIAARLLRTPEPPFEIRNANRISPADQLRDVRLQLLCANSQTPFYDERFSNGADGFRIESLPQDCEHMILAINARAWSGRSALSGTIQSIEIVKP
ncbi:hypothetical protein [Altererythrobacter sp.]|uniref:hypothetical protein n=1 Tax=Altererythrobacter sp. TaxID=1872480 RepID=UPI003D079296